MQWCFGAVSRDQYYSTKKLKYPYPPFGAYNLNYKQIDHGGKQMKWEFEKHQSKVKKEVVQPPMRLIELEKDS